MTQANKLKQTIRARARKTGESYTASRLQVLKARQRRASAPPAADAKPAPRAARTAERGSLSQASVIARTGHDLDHWFAVLDAFGAPTKGHTAMARHLALDHGVPGWYAQGITVTYERERGLRAVNQASDGFQVSVTKSMAAPMESVTEALRSRTFRKRWLKDIDPGLAQALAAGIEKPRGKGLFVRPDGSAGLRFPWDGSTVEFRITPKPKGGISLATAHTKLADATQVEDRRTRWRAVLDALKAALER
jgi:hypothetical protein